MRNILLYHESLVRLELHDPLFAVAVRVVHRDIRRTIALDDSENLANGPIGNEVVVGENPYVSAGSASQNLDKVPIGANISLIPLVTKQWMQANEILHKSLGSVVRGVVAYHDLDSFFSECLVYDKIEALLKLLFPIPGWDSNRQDRATTAHARFSDI
jgi:hypothetical protein